MPTTSKASRMSSDEGEMGHHNWKSQKPVGIIQSRKNYSKNRKGGMALRPDYTLLFPLGKIGIERGKAFYPKSNRLHRSLSD
jgi:hypothetical protein